MAQDNNSKFDMESPEQSVVDAKLKADIGEVEGKVASADPVDGVMTRVTPMNASFLHRMATADDNAYNEMKTAYFENRREGQLFSAAWSEAKFLGMDTEPLFTRLVTGNAREKGGLLDRLTDTIGRSTYNFNDGRNKRGNSRKGSPLS